MLENTRSPGGSEVGSSTCKPNYKQMIIREKESLTKTQRLRDALSAFVGPIIMRLLGELTSREISQQDNINRWIKQQSEDV